MLIPSYVLAMVFYPGRNPKVNRHRSRLRRFLARFF